MKKKTLALLTVMAMMLTLLTGCVGEVIETTVKTNGSGTINIKVGYTEEFINSMGDTALEELQENPDIIKFRYNGVDYWGSAMSQDFADVDELNAILNSVDGNGVLSEEVAEELKDIEDYASYIKFERRDNGTFKITLSGNPANEMSGELMGSELSEEDLAELKAGLLVVMEFNMPSAVKQIAGSYSGVKISGTKLTLDLMKVDNTKGDLVFETTEINTSSGGETCAGDTGAGTIANVSNFKDIKATDWYYDAVKAMINSGYMHGVSTTEFKPNDYLTYAQFCTILANALGKETGTVNGYWAYKAIDEMLNAGYIPNMGAITSANYDKPITREAAIACMYEAMCLRLEEKGKTGNYEVSDIPDASEISTEFILDILLAYDYGITTGVDSSHTFNPKGSLTRAQISQLFYNVGLAK